MRKLLMSLLMAGSLLGVSVGTVMAQDASAPAAAAAAVSDTTAADAAAGARGLRMPHLLVDCGYSHTISLGPAVYPGSSACLDCHVTRLQRRWGDPPAPAQPLVLANNVLIAGWIAAEAQRLHDGSTALINRTAAYDIESHRLTAGTVHRLPGCSRCDLEDATIDLWQRLR